MLIARLIIGSIIFIFGAYSILTGNTLFWREGKTKYTKDSLTMYTKLSGILRMMIGLGIMFFNVGHSSQSILLLSWTIMSISWVAVATNIILHLIVLVKK